MTAGRKPGGQKTGGRQKGTPNKTTAEARPELARVVGDYLQSEQFKTDLAELDAKDRLLVIEKYASYVLPKLQATSFELTKETSATIEDKLRNLSGQDDD